jgi:hypothetical protein
MRITPDLVAQSPQFTNPLNDREIKLRAYKIPAVENLGATQDQFDVIDLSDNEIRKLEVRRPPPAAAFARHCWPPGLLRARWGLCVLRNMTFPPCSPARGIARARSAEHRISARMRAPAHLSVCFRAYLQRRAFACCPRLPLASWPLFDAHERPCTPLCAALPISRAACLRACFPVPQNFPLLKRLKTLLLSNNLIFRIGEDLKDSLPNLHTIMLANNSLLNIRDLKPFASLPSLRRLCLIDNNVTKQVLSLAHKLDRRACATHVRMLARAQAYKRMRTEGLCFGWQSRECMHSVSLCEVMRMRLINPCTAARSPTPPPPAIPGGLTITRARSPTTGCT